MSYDKRFNNTLAIWSAFGGRGNLLFTIPTLTWQKVNYSHFGYTKYGSETKINVYDNGSSVIASYSAKTPYTAYWNKTTKQWTLSNVTWWNNGQPEILWAGDGVYLAKIVGLANIISSYDGITWYNAGYCSGAYNAMTCGAYDIIRKCGVVSWWYYKSPVYYNYQDLKTRVAWTLVGSDGTSVPIFKYLTAHKGNFVGVVGGDLSIARASSASPGAWVTTINEDQRETHYMFIRSVHGKLFVMKWYSTYANGKYTYYVRLCVLSDDATQLIETNLSHVGDLADNRIANPQNIIWMNDWGKFALFNQGMLYVSDDGITWEGKAQPGFTTREFLTFEGAIYVPGKGFYVSCNDDYVYFAEY